MLEQLTILHNQLEEGLITVSEFRNEIFVECWYETNGKPIHVDDRYPTKVVTILHEYNTIVCGGK